MKPKRIALIGATWPIYEIYCPNFSGMTDGLAKLQDSEGFDFTWAMHSCRPKITQEILDAIVDSKPDLVIYCLLDMVKNKEARMYIRNKLPDAKIIMWYGDLRNEQTGQINANMSEIDMMFVSNNAQNEFYKKKWLVPDCRFLPLGASIKVPVYNPKFDFDFVFIGARITGTGFLERAIDTGNLKAEEGLTIIDGRAENPNLRARILQSMHNIYYSSKVCLDISHFTDIDSYTSNRFWNITASGGFALTKRFPNCEQFYPEGTRVYFDTIEECIKLKDYYLAHPKEREAIRKAGYEHAKNHTYVQRFKDMFAMVYGG